MLLSQQLKIKKAISQAKKAIQQGNTTLALELYNSALQLQPNHPIARKCLSKLQNKMPQNQAIQAQTTNPPQDQINLLINLYHSGKMVDAEQKCQELLQTYPQSFIVLNLLGAALKVQGKLQGAVQTFNKAIQLKPDYAEAYCNRGNALKDLRKLKEAVENYDNAIKCKPDFADAHYNRGNALKNLDQLKEAVESYDKAIALKNNFEDAYLNRGIALKDLGHLKEAVWSYDKAIQLNSDYAEAYCNRGNALKDLRKLKEAVENYDKAIELKNDFTVAYFNRGVALNDLGQLKESVDSYSRAISLNPDLAAAYCNRGNALKDLRKLVEAIESYDKAIQLNPDSAEAYCNRGVALKKLGQLKNAVESYDKAINLNPNFADAHYNRGNALQALDQTKDAVGCYDKAIQLNPEYAEAYNNRGNSQNYLGRPKEAVENYNKAIQLKPDYAEAHRHLTSVKKFTRKDAHIELMGRILTNSDTSESGRKHLLFALAKAFDDLGEYDKSFSYLKKGNYLRKKELNYNISDARSLTNKTRDLFSAENQDLHVATEESPSVQSLFILGMPRSGTTLVEQIIASHSKVHGAGELRTMTPLVMPILANLTDPFNRKDNCKLSTQHIKKIHDGYIDKLTELKVTEKIITDKMPLNFRWIGFILSALPKSKIIHLNRDPRATCWSIFKHYFSDTGNGYAYDMSDLAEFYNLYIDLMSFWRERFPDRIYDLYYEELTENQEKETRRLLEFCDLKWEEQCLDFYNTKRPVKTSSSNQVRKKMYKGSSAAWKKYEVNLQPLIKGLGY